MYCVVALYAYLVISDIVGVYCKRKNNKQYRFCTLVPRRPLRLRTIVVCMPFSLTSK